MLRFEDDRLAESGFKKKLTLALVGGETLLGKKLIESLAKDKKHKIFSFSASGEGNLTQAEGEAVYLEPLEERTIHEAKAVILAGNEMGARKAYELGKAANGQLELIDCTGYLEGEPEARIVAPLVQDVQLADDWLLVLAHPAASALALILKRLQGYRKLRQVVVHIFEPASGQGMRGVTELHEQTTSLLAFKPLKKETFDVQVAFNLHARYGEDGKASLSEIEQRIERHIATILAGERTLAAIPMPSVRVLGAPVFHGYSFSLWAEFETDIRAQDLREALASAQIDVRGEQDDAPDAVGAAGQSGLIAGDIRVDRNDAHAVWIWVVADNLELQADAVAELMRRRAEEPS